MSECTITVHDEVWCTLTGLSVVHMTSLIKEFSIHPEGYFFSPAFKFGGWNGYVEFIQKTGKTYVRLLDKILPFIEKWGYNIDLRDNRQVFAPPTTRASAELFGADSKIQLRPYQIDAVNTLVEAGSGILLASTGSGKSLITGALSHIYGLAGYQTITIVPSADLVAQTGEWYSLMGLDVGYYSGSFKDTAHQHLVATWQSLNHNPTIIEPRAALIFDETQGARAAVAQRLLNVHGKNIPFRFGVTATLPKPPADRMSIFSAIGPILKEISARWLIEAGYLARVEIEPVELNETYIDEEFPDYGSEKAFLGKSTARMEIIADLIISKCAMYGNILVLVNNISFGKKLTSLIKDAHFLYGESSKDLRKEHYNMFEENDNVIVIASAGIASTGISINRIFCLMTVDAGKSFVTSLQSLGRGMRRAHDKDAVHVVDVHSRLKWARKHFRERCKHYKEVGYPILKKQTLQVSNE